MGEKDDSKKKDTDEQSLENGDLVQDSAGEPGKSEGDDGLILSELLEEYDSQDDKEERSAEISGEFDELNLEELPDMKFEDTGEKEDSRAEESAESSAEADSEVPSTGPEEIEDDGGDYAAILDQLEKDGEDGSESIEEEASEQDLPEGIEEGEPDIDEMLEEIGESSVEEMVSDVEPVSDAGDAEAPDALDEYLGGEGDIGEADTGDIDTDKADTGELDTGGVDTGDADTIETGAGEEILLDEEPSAEMEDVNFSFADLVSEMDETGKAEGEEEETPETADEDAAPTAAFDALADESGQAEEITEEPDTEAAYSPEVSYAGFIADEEQEGEEEVTADIAGGDDEEKQGEAVGEYELDMKEESEVQEGAGLSYADLIADEAPEGQSAESEEVMLEIDEDQGETADVEFLEESTGEEEMVLDETDLTLDEGGEEFNLDAEDIELESEEKEAPPEDEGIVVSGGDFGEEPAQEEDFLGLDDTEKKDDDSFLGVSDVKEHKLPEIMLEGIEMDAEEQTKLVTRAEILLAQGKNEEAAKIYAQLAEEGGVTPFVSRRLEQFNIEKPKDETVVEVETEESADET